MVSIPGVPQSTIETLRRKDEEARGISSAYSGNNRGFSSAGKRTSGRGGSGSNRSSGSTSNDSATRAEAERKAQEEAQRQAQADAEAKRVAEQNKAQQLQRQSQTGISSGVTTVNGPQTINQRLQQARINFGERGLVRTGSDLVGSIKYDLTYNRNKQAKQKFEDAVRRKQQGAVIDPNVKVRAETNIPSGTSQQVRFKQFDPNLYDKLLRETSQGDAIATEALKRNVAGEGKKVLENVAENELRKDQARVEEYSKKAQARIDRGESTVQIENQKLTEYTKGLDAQRSKRISEEANNFYDLKEKDIKKAENSGRAVRIAQGALVGAAVGAAAVPVIGALPGAVQGTIAVASGLALAKGTQEVATRVIVGEAGVLDVAEFVVPVLAFGAGAGVASKISASRQIKINEAIRSPSNELRVVSSKGLTKEIQVTKLNLPPEQEAKVLAQIRAGEKVFVERKKLFNKDPEKQSLIDKVDPEVMVIGSSKNAQGRVVGTSVTKVNVGKFFRKTTEFQAGVSTGLTSPSTGKAVIDTTVIKTNKRGQAFEVEKSRTFQQARQVEVRDPVTKEIIGRAVRVESKTFKGESIKPKGGQVSLKNIMKVTSSNKFNKKPSTQTTRRELQKVIRRRVEGIKEDQDAILRQEAYLSAIDVAEVSSQISNSKKINSPKRRPSDITFSKDQAKKLTESLRDIYGNNPQIEKEIRRTQIQSSKSEKKVENAADNQAQVLQSEFYGKGLYETTDLQTFGLGKSDQSKNIIDAIKRGQTELVARTKVKNVEEITPLSGSNVLQLKKSLSGQKLNFLTLGLDRGAVNNNIKFQQVNVNTSKLNQRLRSQQRQLQNQLQQPNYSISAPVTPTFPTFEFTPFIPPGPGSLPGGRSKRAKKLNKKQLRSIQGYTASLAAAALQSKAIKVSRKRYEQLQKTVFSGLESRPVLEIVDDKETRKAVRAVQF